jgi:phosphoglucomutase
MLLYKVCCVVFRYDYENCDAESCAAMMNKLEQIVTSPVYVGTKIIHRNKSYIVKLADNFRYEDPVDGSITERQVGYRAPQYVHRLLEVDIMKCLFTNTCRIYPNTRWLCI